MGWKYLGELIIAASGVEDLAFEGCDGEDACADKRHLGVDAAAHLPPRPVEEVDCSSACGKSISRLVGC